VFKAEPPDAMFTRNLWGNYLVLSMNFPPKADLRDAFFLKLGFLSFDTLGCDFIYKVDHAAAMFGEFLVVGDEIAKIGKIEYQPEIY